MGQREWKEDIFHALTPIDMTNPQYHGNYFASYLIAVLFDATREARPYYGSCTGVKGPPEERRLSGHCEVFARGHSEIMVARRNKSNGVLKVHEAGTRDGASRRFVAMSRFPVFAMPGKVREHSRSLALAHENFDIIMGGFLPQREQTWTSHWIINSRVLLDFFEKHIPKPAWSGSFECRGLNQVLPMTQSSIFIGGTKKSAYQIHQALQSFYDSCGKRFMDQTDRKILKKELNANPEVDRAVKAKVLIETYRQVLRSHGTTYQDTFLPSGPTIFNITASAGIIRYATKNELVRGPEHGAYTVDVYNVDWQHAAMIAQQLAPTDDKHMYTARTVRQMWLREMQYRTAGAQKCLLCRNFEFLRGKLVSPAPDFC